MCLDPGEDGRTGEQLRGSRATHAFYTLDSFRGGFKSVTDLHISDRVLLINSILTSTYIPAPPPSSAAGLPVGVKKQI